MSTPAKPALSPIALKQGEGEALWFFGSLAIVKAGSETIAGRVSVTELLGRQGSGSPLHVHHREDEWFYILEGELTFWVGGRIIKAPSRVRAVAHRPAPGRRYRRDKSRATWRGSCARCPPV